MADPYARDYCNGKLLDVATIAAVRQMEADLGYPVTILQGVGGALASAGTHLGLNGKGGRAIDFAPWDYRRKVRWWRDNVGPGWHRPELPGVWGEHCHCLTALNSLDNAIGIAPAGFAQIGDYYHGGPGGVPGDGLAGTNRDPDPYRPSPPVVFIYPPKEKPVPLPPETKVTKARDALAEADAAMSKALAFLRDVPESRTVVHGQVDDLKASRHTMRQVLEILPKR